MSAAARARICWLPPDAGGRDSPPPGPRYSTVARFADLAARWPDEAWSIVADFLGKPDQSGCVEVALRFLVEDAPSGLLRPGSRFDLFEGDQLVATGEVLAVNK